MTAYAARVGEGPIVLETISTRYDQVDYKARLMGLDMLRVRVVRVWMEVEGG